MSVNGINSSVAATSYGQTNTKGTTKKADNTKTNEDVGVVYEKSAEVANTSKKTYTIDQDTVARLKAELTSKSNQLQGLVEKLLGKQANKATSIYDLLTGLKNGTVKVDAATAAQAQSEISEDGYWGVKQTSDRLVEMAKALSGGDASKADTMIAAMKKGFEQATKAFGQDLPDISSQTIKSAEEKLLAWKNSLTSEE